MQDINPEEERLGYIWFFCGGAVALLVAFMIYKADVLVSDYHERDRVERTSMMGELRLAQTSLGAGAVDPRIESKLVAVDMNPTKEHASEHKAHNNDTHASDAHH